MMHVIPTVTRTGERLSAAFSVAALEIALTCFSGCPALHAQAQHPCGADGYRVVAQTWDALLKRGWESRQECAHPEWPLRLVAMHPETADDASPRAPKSIENAVAAGSTEVQSPLLVKAGDVVRLWMQDASVRIEMSGVVERSAHHGEQVTVQITRHDDETGLTVQRMTGTVSGAGEVEMER